MSHFPTDRPRSDNRQQQGQQLVARFIDGAVMELRGYVNVWEESRMFMIECADGNVAYLPFDQLCSLVSSEC